MTAPLFSVILPTFNRGRFVVEALDSALGQTYPNLEIVVVDDGSTDDTEVRVSPYLDRIRYVRKPNGGPSSAKNAGVHASRGEVIGFLDSDDLWEPETVDEVARAFRDHAEAGLVSIMAREILSDGRRTSVLYGKRSPGAEFSTASLLGADAGGCSWFFVRRELFRQAGGFDEQLRSAEECDLCVRLSFRARMHALRKPLLLRRLHDGNLSHDIELNARCWIRLLEKLGRDRPEFVRTHRRVFRRALAKARLRLGRELLAKVDSDRGSVREARSQLMKSATGYPPFLRTHLYLLWSLAAPSTYAGWRRLELRLRAPRDPHRSGPS